MDAKVLHRCLDYVTGGTCEVYVVSREYVSRIFYMGRSLLVAANTSSSDENGHWVVFFTYYSPDGIVSEYYDSFGSTDPTQFLIDNPYPIVQVNPKRHQDDKSPSCSLFVIYFAYHRINKPPYCRAISYFSKSLSRNEQLVLKLYNHIKDSVAKLPDTNTQCQKFGCYPKSNNSLKRKYEN